MVTRVSKGGEAIKRKKKKYRIETPTGVKSTYTKPTSNKQYQGAVRPTDDEEHFRNTGETRPKDNRQVQGAVQEGVSEKHFRRTGESIKESTLEESKKEWNVMGLINEIWAPTWAKENKVIAQPIALGLGIDYTGSISAIGKIPKAVSAISSWVQNHATALGLSTAAAFMAKELIGTYTMSGFLTEETLQTTNWGASEALKNGDIKGAKDILKYEEEILKSNLFGELADKIPFVNVVNAVKDFKKATQLKHNVSMAVLEDLEREQKQSNRNEGEVWTEEGGISTAFPEEYGVETGETKDDFNKNRIETEKQIQEIKKQYTEWNAQFWEKQREKEKQSEKEITDYFNQQKKLYKEWELEAEKKNQKETAEFWRKERDLERKKEKEFIKWEAEFWREYKKLAANTFTPSNLNFGLL